MTRSGAGQRGYLWPMAVLDVRAGLDAAGSITAWDFLDINAGASGFAFPYAVPNRRLRYHRPIPRTRSARTVRCPRPPTPSRASCTSTSWRTVVLLKFGHGV